MSSKIQAVLSYVGNEPQWPELSSGDLRALVILVTLVVLIALERRHACRRYAKSVLRQSYLTNLGSLLFNDTLMSLLSVSSLFWFAEQYGSFGLLRNIEDPFWQALAGLLAIDLGMYWWHRANHTYEWLWMFHKAHHSDRSMNASTAFRLHFIEVLLTTLVKAALVFVLGISSWVLLLSETLLGVFVLWHHANLRIPGERWLSWALIVPSLHRVHHSVRRTEHDNNYGALSSIWDRWFGTLIVLEPEEIGLRSIPGQNLWQFLLFGLPRPVGTMSDVLPERVAEAAYYRAEKRGFAPGHEMADWLEAEREIVGSAVLRLHRLYRWQPYRTLSAWTRRMTDKNGNRRSRPISGCCPG